MESYDTWGDVIDELDAVANLDRKSQDFIIDLIEQKPRFLSSRQIEWLKDLQRQHLL